MRHGDLKFVLLKAGVDLCTVFLMKFLGYVSCLLEVDFAAHVLRRLEPKSRPDLRDGAGLIVGHVLLQHLLLLLAVPFRGLLL